MATLDRLLRDGKWGAISGFEMLMKFVEYNIFVPSQTPVDGQLKGLEPLTFDRDGTVMVGVFSNADLAAKRQDQYPHVTEIHAFSFIKSLNPELGLVLNPGEEFGLALLPDHLAEMRQKIGGF